MITAENGVCASGGYTGGICIGCWQLDLPGRNPCLERLASAIMRHMAPSQAAPQASVVLPIGIPAGLMDRSGHEPPVGAVWLGDDCVSVSMAQYQLWSASFAATTLERLMALAGVTGVASADANYEQLRKLGLVAHLTGTLARDSGFLRTYRLHLCAVGMGNSRENPGIFELAWPDGSPRAYVGVDLYPILFASSHGIAIWDACTLAASAADDSAARLAEAALRDLPLLISTGVALLDRKLA